MRFRLWPQTRWPRTAAPPAPGSRLRPSPHVLATAQGDELVLLDRRRERYYTLNEVGSRAWALLREGATPARIADVIRGEYAVPAGPDGDPVARDIARLIAELHAAGLVVAERPPEGRW